VNKLRQREAAALAKAEKEAKSDVTLEAKLKATLKVEKEK
jgi:hypothetical protein